MHRHLFRQEQKSSDRWGRIVRMLAILAWQSLQTAGVH